MAHEIDTGTEEAAHLKLGRKMLAFHRCMKRVTLFHVTF